MEWLRCRYRRATFNHTQGAAQSRDSRKQEADVSAWPRERGVSYHYAVCRAWRGRVFHFSVFLGPDVVQFIHRQQT